VPSWLFTSITPGCRGVDQLLKVIRDYGADETFRLRDARKDRAVAVSDRHGVAGSDAAFGDAVLKPVELDAADHDGPRDTADDDRHRDGKNGCVRHPALGVGPHNEIPTCDSGLEVVAVGEGDARWRFDAAANWHSLQVDNEDHANVRDARCDRPKRRVADGSVEILHRRHGANGDEK
jgi:hypothetical protein